MALKNTPAPVFETEDNSETEGIVMEPANMETTPAAEVKTTTLATQGSRAVATASAVMKQNVISGLQDAFRVEYDSLPSIGASQGTFSIKSDDTDIGPEIKIQLLSYQDSYTCGPNDTKADVELVKYSDDGITSRDGVDLRKHLNDLLEQGYTKAKIAHRVILVGELLDTKNPCNNIGELVQIDLPDSGRRAFNSYTLQASYAVAKGRKTPEEATILTLKAVIEKSKAGEKYTKVAIS